MSSVDVMVLIIGAIVVTVVIVLVVVVPLSIRAERRRKAALAGWAHAHGWSYAERVRADWTGRLPGRNKRGLGVTLTGQLDGRWVTVADYSYETTSSSNFSSTSHSTTSTTTHYYIVIVVHLPQPHRPVAVLTRGLFSQLGRTLFGDKPTATGNPDFDSRFRIVSPDPRYAHWLVGKDLIAAHLHNTVPHWSVGNHDLVTYRPGRLKDPNAIPALAAPLLHVAALFPR
ncbi:hypothetical protein [Nocardia brasiliensis]|uniref:hypothetical protein n=1 Tax=Nocardia brasiliensis TaxID=37326 RepID=UPI0024552922|nr:hypothetical protein [Nocardia brasiliensis]